MERGRGEGEGGSVVQTKPLKGGGNQGHSPRMPTCTFTKEAAEEMRGVGSARAVPQGVMHLIKCISAERPKRSRKR